MVTSVINESNKVQDVVFNMVHQRIMLVNNTFPVAK